MNWDELIADARRDISDADRCVALSITPAAYQLHRRLRQVTQAMEELLTDEAVERAARAMDENFNPDKHPVMAAMFRDYAKTAITAAIEGEQ